MQERLRLRDKLRKEWSAFHVNSNIEVLLEFKNHSLSNFNSDGLFADLCRKLYKRHLGLDISKRESEIILHIASGHSKTRITELLQITEHNYHTYKQRIFRKLESVGFMTDEFDHTVMIALITLRLMGQMI